MPSPQTREEVLFAAALEMPADKRDAFLKGACLGDPVLRQRVEVLLSSHDQPEPLPSPGAPAVVATIKLDLAEVEDEAVGKTIGRYKVLEKVGEGGCGVVYVAEQTEPVRRRVALKVIKLGMDTKQVVARFEAERQALAMMDHPNIAKVLDAGATETGRPYFVMELVRGIKITEYCDQANLTTTARLDLFIKVCQAIQHAHQKGIIHRDIKPSNILVTLHDGVPVPKVIDFGIAKATVGQTLTDKTVYTQLQQFIGTPAYMSPEQAEMSGLDIDTRSDIYSLGVLLYELLTGRTPFSAEELAASGLDAMRKTIREKEPVRPSTRLGTLSGEEQTTTAKRRSADTAKLLHQLKGDLDWIVMKCLEKDRTRRYETANGVAFDLKRHLNNEPVLARPPSAAYKFQKAFRRNKLVFAAGTAVAIALVAGLCLAALGWRQTSVERDKAVQAKAQAVAAQANEIKQRQLADAARDSETKLREQAQAAELAARRRAYAADMNLLQQALEMNNLGRAKALLDRQRPAPGEVDLRGWEWRYLWSQTHADEHEVFLAGTNRMIAPLSFSADGRLLARDYNGETVVTDLISRRTVLQRTNVWNPVFAHHGAVLAFAGSVPSATNAVITLLNMDTQKETQLVTSGGQSRWFGFTPDDRRILMISGPDANNRRLTTWGLTAWDLDTMQPLWQRRILTGYQNYRPYAISPDGTAFAAVLLDGRVEVLETKDGTERFTIKTTEETAEAVMFSPDSSTLLTAAGYTDSTIRLWDARDGKAAGSLDGHHSFVSDLIFTPDGKLLISSSGDETIRLWDWATREPAGVLRGHLGEVDGLALAPDGRTLASRCKDGSIYLWDVTKPSRHLGYQKLPDRLLYYEATFTPDSQSILAVEQVGAEGGAVALWDAHTLKKTPLSGAESTNRYNITISGDARWVARKDAGGHIRVWDARSASESTNFLLAPASFVEGFTDNGKFLLTANRSAWALSAAPLVVAAWDTDTWRKVGAFRFTNTEGAFTPSLPNSFVIVADGAIRFFDVNKMNEASRQIVNPPGNLNGLATSPDGRLAAGAYGSGHVRLWDLTTLQPVATLNGFLLGAHSVAFSPDGRRLAAASNGRETVKLWDSETLQEVLTLSGEGSLYGGLKFSADGRYLLAINEAGLALLWSAPTWAEIAAAEAKDPPSQSYRGQGKAEIKQP